MKSQSKKIIIHFIGIGGIGMSAIAEVMHDLGYKVQGSDLFLSENTKRLKNKGIKIFINHHSKNIQNATTVVYSSAIKKNNVEIISSKKLSIPLVSRADILSELMKNKKSIAIAGSHGKTTTTSLIGNILDTAKFDPTIINGGIINSYSKNNKLGNGEWLVAEADESDGSFLKLPHQISVITNIDIEHLDYYVTKSKLINSFKSFILNLPFYGYSIVCVDNIYLKKIANKIKTRNIITYSIKNNSSDIYIKEIKNNSKTSFFSIVLNKKINGYKGKYKFKINLLGDHNILNVTASIIASLLTGVNLQTIKKGLINYKGVKRRFSFIGKKKKSIVIDDYAHHPTEIQATYLAAKKINQNVIVVFQPHRYSRTKILMKEFIKVLSKINKLYILKTYPAGEKVIKNATSEKLFMKLSKRKNLAVYVDNENNLENYLNKHIHQNGIILFMGAGSITKIANDFVKIND